MTDDENPGPALPALREFDESDYASRVQLARAAGHVLSVEQTRRGAAYGMCSCGWEGRGFAMLAAAVQQAQDHMLETSRDVLEFARARGIELQPAAAEFTATYRPTIRRQRRAAG